MAATGLHLGHGTAGSAPPSPRSDCSRGGNAKRLTGALALCVARAHQTRRDERQRSRSNGRRRYARMPLSATAAMAICTMASATQAAEAVHHALRDEPRSASCPIPSHWDTE